MKYLAIFLLVAVATAQELQPRQFLTQIVRQTGSGETIQHHFLAHGVMIDQRHLVTVANVLHNVPRAELHVYLETDIFMNSTDIREVQEVFIHDQFNINSQFVNNVAVIRVPYAEGDSVAITPRNLGTLEVAECRVFSFPGNAGELVTTTVPIRATECPDNMPFCATVTFPAEVTSCGGILGSPTICANQLYAVGIVNTDMDCHPLGFPVTGRMTFLGFQDYNDWIRRVTSGANENVKISAVLLLLGVAIGKFLM